MNPDKRKALEEAGYVVGNAEDFLQLTPGERELVQLRLQVSRAVKRLRIKQHLTQEETATRLATSQPRYARIEAGRQGVSLDLMVRTLYALGGTMKDVSA